MMKNRDHYITILQILEDQFFVDEVLARDKCNFEDAELFAALQWHFQDLQILMDESLHDVNQAFVTHVNRIRGLQFR